MSNVKNFGLIGVGADLQFGKAGTHLVNNAGTFNFKAANGSTDAALTAAGITSSAGNVTLTTGDLVLTDTAGVLTVGTDTTLSRAQAGVFRFNGTAAVVMPAGTTGQEPGTQIAGMFRYNSTLGAMEYSNGTSWFPLSSSAALQTEIDNIETSLGGAIDSSGNFIPGGFTGAVIGTVASFTEAIQNVANYALSKDTLDEIFLQTGAGKVIYSNGTSWQQALPGSTSGVQKWDAGLDNLAALAGTGIVVETADGVFANRTLVAPAAGITITDADGVAGNPTFALANDLAALEGLTTTGYIVRTGDGTATTRSMNVVSGDLVITGDASGVSTDTTFGLATVTQAATGNFVKVTLDTKGRVTGNTPVVAADITALVDATYVNVTGDTMTGSLTMATGTHITLTDDPVNPTDAANKNYVDNAVTGLTWKTAVLAATTTNGTFATAFANGQVIDGVTLATNDRILIKNQTDQTQNGIYIVQASGAPVRSSDANTGPELDSAAVFVQTGTANADSGWVQVTSNVTIGTSNIVWQQFSGAGAYTSGVGIDITGNVISTRLGAGIGELPTGEIGVDLYDPTNGAVILTTDGTTPSTATGAQLYLKLDAAGALAQTSSGLKINANSVTNAMIVNDTMVVNGDTGSGSLALGGTLEVKGTSTQGIVTSVNGTGTFTVTASNASSSQKGVATFDATEFTVTTGNVVLGTVPIGKLSASTITFAGNTGTPDAVALGETVTISSADSAITTTAGANSISIQLNTVDVPHGGTGATSFTANQILFGNGTSAIQSDAGLTFTPGSPVATLAMGGATGLTLTTNATSHDVTLTAAGSNADIVLVPTGTGSVVVGPVGAGLIQSDAATALTVRGNTTLTLESGTGSTTMVLPSGTSNKVTVSGPTAADYATGLAAADLVNKQYVDGAIATGASAGSVKAVTATVSLASAGTVNVGAALPAGATILSVKVNVTAADTATGTLQIGKSGGGQYMATTENDTQTTGLYLAETYVVEAGSVQVQATVGGTPGGSGSAQVFVEYKVAG